MTLMKSVFALESELGLHVCADSAELPFMPAGSRIVCSCKDYIFCFLQGYQYTVFGVHFDQQGTVEICPLAYDFLDFIRLVLACGSASAVAELGFCCLNGGNSETLMNSFVREKSLSHIAVKLGVIPLEHPDVYIKTVTHVIDFSRIYR